MIQDAILAKQQTQKEKGQTGKQPEKQKQQVTKKQQRQIPEQQGERFPMEQKVKQKLMQKQEGENRQEQRQVPVQQDTQQPKRKRASAKDCLAKRRAAMGTLEIVIIIAVLLSLALIFRKQITGFANDIMGKVFDSSIIDQIGVGQ